MIIFCIIAFALFLIGGLIKFGSGLSVEDGDEVGIGLFMVVLAAVGMAFQIALL